MKQTTFIKRTTSKICATSLIIISALSSCSSSDGDTSNSGGGNGDGTGGEEIVKNYPSNAIVWTEDSTVVLTDHFIVPQSKCLYIEPGVKVIAANSVKKPEIIALGSLYSMGTESKPVVFTVADSLKTDRFSRNWGGIICGFDCQELYLAYTTLEYCGAQTTEESPSYLNSLFKTETGEGVPAVHFCNADGRMVIENCKFFNNAEDHIYITGGKSIVANNKFISNGYDGGEAVNYKSDCEADICYNLIYDANTNGFKLSNAGLTSIQSDLNVYNNTIVNSGWRRPKVKGGSIWMETSILVKLQNNLVYDCRWGLKHATDEGEDAASVVTPNYYYASTSTGVAQMQANAEAGIINGANDIMSLTAGEKNPLFLQYTQQSNVNINVGANEGDVPQTWSDNWDFHLSAASPALTGGTLSAPRHFGITGITMSGLSGIIASNIFTSPQSSAYFGAFGQK